MVNNEVFAFLLIFQKLHTKAYQNAWNFVNRARIIFTCFKKRDFEAEQQCKN